MTITDAQVHIWGANTPGRPWPAGGEARAQRPVPLGAEELISEMDGAGVERAVIVPPSWEGDRNDVAIAAARTYPTRLAVMGRVDLRRPDDVDLSSWKAQAGMLGVRHTFHVDVDVADAEWFWPRALEADLPVMLFAPGQTAALGAVARQYRGLRVIIDHLNASTAATLADLAEIIDALLPLSELENVAVKVSALPCLLRGQESIHDLAPHIRRVVDAFGVERCMWGSDISRLSVSYRSWVEAGMAGFGVLSARETQQLMGESCSTWLDWPPSRQ